MNPIFARITKIDEERREVTGRAAQEVIDRDNELFDYASSKPEFMKWSAEVSADTNGASLGNVRSMHGNCAAGKLTDIQFNDVEKAIDITAKIVDDNEWKKCLEGVHTGFSIGGRYARKWAEPVNGKIIQRYTAVPTEISVVDRPCCPTAKFFSIHKRDGSVEQKEFQNTEGMALLKGLLSKGGPGSGPHAGGGGRRFGSPGEKELNHQMEAKNSKTMANRHSYMARKDDKEGNSHGAAAHRAAADAHRAASAAHASSEKGADKLSTAAFNATGEANRASKNGAYLLPTRKFDSSLDLSKAALDFNAAFESFQKGGPGSGPRAGGGKGKYEQSHAASAGKAAARASKLSDSKETSKAAKATERANAKTGGDFARANAHENAGFAHDEAADKAREAGNTRAANAHESAADHHHEIAGHLRGYNDSNSDGRTVETF